MKFFWAAPLDLIDPTYDFIRERGIYGCANQKCQKYPHEIFGNAIYNGFIISKIYVDQGKNCRWNSSQLNRFLREGAKRFLKLPFEASFEVMGDSGAFTRSFSPQIEGHMIDECKEVLNYYDLINVDYGLAPDNIIPGLWTEASSRRDRLPHHWNERWKRTLELAKLFWELCEKKKVKWKPIGVAQGWDAQTYQEAVVKLQEIGYSYIAMGGLNRLNNVDILNILLACSKVRKPATAFHLLGVSRLEHVSTFEKYGVVSFDSSMPIRQAINDDKHNYHSSGMNYIAIKVPQTQASPRLIKLVRSKELDEAQLFAIEKGSLDSLRKYDRGELGLQEVLSVLKKGIEYRAEKNFLAEYKELLADKPWKRCDCTMCKELGIEIVILRNRERNLRRGFHNLYVLSNQLNNYKELSNYESR